MLLIKVEHSTYWYLNYEDISFSGIGNLSKKPSTSWSKLALKIDRTSPLCQPSFFFLVFTVLPTCTYAIPIIVAVTRDRSVPYAKKKNQYKYTDIQSKQHCIWIHNGTVLLAINMNTAVVVDS